MKNIGASVDRITICIHFDNIVEMMTTLINDSEQENFIRNNIISYIHGLKNKSFRRRYQNNDLYFCYSELFDANVISKKFMERFNKSLDDNFEVEKYLKITPCRKEQAKNDKNIKEDENNIYFEFDVFEYKKRTRKNDAPEYFLTLVKIFLFLELLRKFWELYTISFSAEKLFNGINNIVDNSIVTGLELTDTLKSSKLLYEDYFYELLQAKMNSKSNTIIKNLKKQHITFSIKEAKTYLDEDINAKMIKRAEESASDKEDEEYAFNDYLIETEIKEILQDNPFVEEKYGINLYDFVYSLYPEPDIGEYFDYYLREEEKKLIHREKNPTTIFIQKNDKVKDGKGIKIYLKLYNAKNINKFVSLSVNGQNNREVLHAREIAEEIFNNVQIIFNGVVYNVLKNIDGCEENFNNIERSTFGIEVKFIRDKILPKKSEKKKENIVPISLLVLLMAKNEAENKNRYLSMLTGEQRRNLDGLFKILKRRLAIARNTGKQNAVYTFYKHFEGNR